MNEKSYLTVSQLTAYVARKFSADPYLRRVYVKGQLTNFHRRPTHQYFSIKDDNAVMRVVMFASKFRRVRFKPADGMEVQLSGHVAVYEKSGEYQFYADTMEPAGIGDLYIRFKQMAEKLEKEGLFSRPKKQLPLLPKKIAVITSRSGAVIHDIITTAGRRDPQVQIVLFPAAVQGDQAADQLVARIEQINELRGFDDIIIGRGGGSLEDLWPFNEEQVGRAIAASQIPVISSVGHETDTTIADLAADKRAATPTAAAEMATPVLTDLVSRVTELTGRLTGAFNHLLQVKQQQVKTLANSYIFKQPERLYEGYLQNVENLSTSLQQTFQIQLNQRQQDLQRVTTRLMQQNPHNRMTNVQTELANISNRLTQATKHQLTRHRQQLVGLTRELQTLDPYQVMKRGYTFISSDGHIINGVNGLQKGQHVTLNFYDGQAEAQIEKTKENDNANAENNEERKDI